MNILDRLLELAKGEKPTGYLTNEDGNVFPVFGDKYQPKDMVRHIEIVETIARNTKDPQKRAVHEARLTQLKQAQTPHTDQAPRSTQSTRPTHTMSRDEYIAANMHRYPEYVKAAHEEIRQQHSNASAERRLQEQHLAHSSKYRHNEDIQKRVKDATALEALLERHLRNYKDTGSIPHIKDEFLDKLNREHVADVKRALETGEDIDSIPAEFEALKAPERLRRAKNPTTPEGHARLRAYNDAVFALPPKDYADKVKGSIHDVKRMVLDRLLTGTSPEKVVSDASIELQLRLPATQAARTAGKKGLKEVEALAKEWQKRATPDAQLSLFGSNHAQSHGSNHAPSHAPTSRK